MDARTEIRRAVDTGKVLFGSREVEVNVLKGTGVMLIISSNLAGKKKQKMEHIAELSKIPSYHFDGNSIELGSVCGKPFAVSAMLILETGKSRVKDLTAKQ